MGGLALVMEKVLGVVIFPKLMQTEAADVWHTKPSIKSKKEAANF